MFVLDLSQSIQLLIDLLFILLVMTGCTVLYVIYMCVCTIWMSLLSSSWQCGACCLFIQRLHHLFYLSYFSLPLSPFYPFSWLSPGVVLVSVLPLGHLHRNWMVQTRKRRVPELWVSLSLYLFCITWIVSYFTVAMSHTWVAHSSPLETSGGCIHDVTSCRPYEEEESSERERERKRERKRERERGRGG